MEQKAIVKKETYDVANPPDIVLAEAKKASLILKEVVDSKPKPVIINGERYLEFEDYQTLARFYGMAVKTHSAEPVLINGTKGAKAKADVILATTGITIGGADAYCLTDEPNWKNKPFFQLASMAQTRAAAKALRSILGCVAVLAGYRTTPAEEMDGVEVHKPSPQSISIQQQPKSESANGNKKEDNRMSTVSQQKAIYAMFKEKLNLDDYEIHETLKNRFNIESAKDLTIQQASNLITELNNM